MSKTAAARKPLPKMPAAKKVTTAPKPKPKADTAPVAGAKPHTRKPKPSEEDRIAKGKRLAANHLVHRDGMDEDTAKMVVDSMAADDINLLISEANTAVLEQTPAADSPVVSSVAPAELPSGSAVPEQEDADIPPIDFLSVPALAEDETFPEIAIRCRDAAQLKNEYEKKYKADKKVLDQILKEAGIDKKQPVTCLGAKLVRYTGYTTSLDATLLLQAGVDPDIIKKCYKSVPYDDVRITTPKEG